MIFIFDKYHRSNAKKLHTANSARWSLVMPSFDSYSVQQSLKKVQFHRDTHNSIWIPIQRLIRSRIWCIWTSNASSTARSMSDSYASSCQTNVRHVRRVLRQDCCQPSLKSRPSTCKLRWRIANLKHCPVSACFYNPQTVILNCLRIK